MSRIQTYKITTIYPFLLSKEGSDRPVNFSHVSDGVIEMREENEITRISVGMKTEKVLMG